MILTDLLLMAVLLGLSAFFSASETAFFSLRRRDLRQLEQTPGFAGGLILRLRSNTQSLLTTVLFGNMLVNISYFALATTATLAASSAGKNALAYALGVGFLAVLIIGGEVVPKAVAVAVPMRFARLAAVPLFLFQKATMPVQKVLGVVIRIPSALLAGRQTAAYLTREELQLLIRATGESGVIDRGERDLMNEVMEFAEIRVREVMVPRVDAVAFEVGANLEQVRLIVREKEISTVPVYEGAIDNVIGVVDAKEVLLSDARALRDHLRPVPLFVPEVARIEPVLHQFRELKCSFAIVVDEYGGWAGIVTLEDIVEEIVGDISDEFEASTKPVRRVGPDQYVLSGSVSIRDWTEIFGISVDLAGVETLGGFIALRLGRLPREGDTVTFGNLTLTVRTIARRRAAEVLIERRDPGEAAEEDAR